MALESITYFQIFGKPLIMWLGIITLLSLLFTASIPKLRQKKILQLSFTVHIISAAITIILAALHGILAIAASL